MSLWILCIKERGNPNELFLGLPCAEVVKALHLWIGLASSKDTALLLLIASASAESMPLPDQGNKQG